MHVGQCLYQTVISPEYSNSSLPLVAWVLPVFKTALEVFNVEFQVKVEARHHFIILAFEDFLKLLSTDLDSHGKWTSLIAIFNLRKSLVSEGFYMNHFRHIYGRHGNLECPHLKADIYTIIIAQRMNYQFLAMIVATEYNVGTFIGSSGQPLLSTV